MGYGAEGVGGKTYGSLKAAAGTDAPPITTAASSSESSILGDVVGRDATRGPEDARLDAPVSAA